MRCNLQCGRFYDSIEFIGAVRCVPFTLHSSVFVSESVIKVLFRCSWTD